MPGALLLVDEAPISRQVLADRLERLLRGHGGNRPHAAEALGLSGATLITKIKTYGLAV